MPTILTPNISQADVGVNVTADTQTGYEDAVINTSLLKA